MSGEAPSPRRLAASCGTLELLGLDAGSRDLRKFRAHFVRQKLNAHLERIFKLARIDYAVMTNDIFSPRESLYFLRGAPVPDCLRTALRMDGLINDFPAAIRQMRVQGYRATAARPSPTPNRAVSSPTGPGESIRSTWPPRWPTISSTPPATGAARRLDNVVIPAARELGLPLALMIGVRRQVNPALRAGRRHARRPTSPPPAAWPRLTRM